MSQPVDVATVTRAIASVLPGAGPFSLHEPRFGAKEKEYVLDCVASGWVSSVGAYVDRFEADLATFTGAKRAVAVVNGTAALHIALLMAGVKPGDEVVMSPLTFVATPNAAAYCGARPHFVDVEERSLGIDADRLRERMKVIAVTRDGVTVNKETGARLAAVVPMHVFGMPSMMEEIEAVCREFAIPMVEDAAESLGSYYHGAHTGLRGVAGALSFNGNKTLTTGGGGALLFADEERGARAKHLTTTARVPAGYEFVHDEIGYNYRMPNLNAALGVAQLERLPQTLAAKRRLADRYRAALAGIDGVRFLDEPEGTTSNYWLNALVLDRPDRELRDRILKATNDRGIMTRPVWTLMHRLPMYADAPRAPLPVAEAMADRVVNLPSSPFLAEENDG